MLFRRKKNRNRQTFQDAQRQFDKQALLLGKILSKSLHGKPIYGSLSDVEFSVFSQWGDDGIIQWLIRNLEISNKSFVEFGVEDFLESNTRFLLMNDNWSGFVMDGSEKNIQKIRQSYYYWKYDLEAVHAFVTKENINNLLNDSGIGPDLGLLHIDIDGMDYWIWDAITSVSADVVIVEYNSVFGSERSIVLDYDPEFQRSRAHYSHLYCGASLKALCDLGDKKGYAFIGSNSSGNNAYFVKREKLNDVVKEVSVKEGYVCSKFRESRAEDGSLNFLSNDQRLKAIKGLPIFNCDTQKMEVL